MKSIKFFVLVNIDRFHLLNVFLEATNEKFQPQLINIAYTFEIAWTANFHLFCSLSFDLLLNCVAISSTYFTNLKNIIEKQNQTENLM